MSEQINNTGINSVGRLPEQTNNNDIKTSADCHNN